jgi:hypothetical protein
MLRRATAKDIKIINGILNDPSIYLAATMGHDVGELDVTAQMKSNNIHVLLVEEGEGGCLILDPYDETTLELHTCLLPSFRGKAAEQVASETLRFAFGTLAAAELLTRVLVSNKGADLFARQVGFVRISDEGLDKDGLRAYQMTVDRWPYVDKEVSVFAIPEMAEIVQGDNFRRTCGAFSLMAQNGYLGHGVSLYNKHARLHGYPRMDVVGSDSIMVGGLIIHFEERNHPKVEVLPCQSLEPLQL